MKKRSISPCSRLLGLFLPAIAVLLTACATENLPTASSPSLDEVSPPHLSQTQTQTLQTASKFGISLSPPGLSKRAGPQKSESKKKLIRARSGGWIVIRNGKTLVTFTVPRRALEEDTWINMEVIGEGPSTVVHFEPSGLHFLKPALLSITFPNDDVDTETLGGYLVEDDGTRTPVPSRVIIGKKRITVLISIAHFSTYDPDDGDENSPPEGSGS